jgi:hypothetical protein
MKTLNMSNPKNSGGYSQAQVDALIAAAKPKFDLLWENSSPTSNFEAQTIELDLSSYDMAYVVLHNYSSQNNVAYLNKNMCQVIFGCASNSTTSGGYNLRVRYATTTDTGITFSNAQQATVVDNGAVKPYEIYGVKL